VYELHVSTLALRFDRSVSVPDLGERKPLGNRNHQFADGKRLSECSEARCVRTRLNLVDFESSFLRCVRCSHNAGPNTTWPELRSKPDDRISSYCVGDGIERAQPALVFSRI
jgi:hypothetical protein